MKAGHSDKLFKKLKCLGREQELTYFRDSVNLSVVLTPPYDFESLDRRILQRALRQPLKHSAIIRG